MFRLRADLIKKLELCLTVVSVLLKIRFGHALISVPKIGTLMSKTACANSINKAVVLMCACLLDLFKTHFAVILVAFSVASMAYWLRH